MITLVNGSQADSISVHDRGLLYGQSLFETIAVNDHAPCLLELHLQRLQKGCKALSIDISLSDLQLDLQRASRDLRRGVLRVTLTMGAGGRGYRNPAQPSCTRIVSAHAMPDYPQHYWQQGVVLGLSDLRLSSQPALAGLKHGNRLEQVLARSSWKDDWQEALLLGQAGEVIEATQCNIFIRSGSVLITPLLENAGVAGVMREYILQNCSRAGTSPEIATIGVDEVESADEVILSNSLIGVWPVKQFTKTRYTDFSISHQLLKLMQQDGAIPTF